MRDPRKHVREIASIMIEAVDRAIFSGSPGTKNVYKRYWKSYGGLAAVYNSAYFRVALLLTIVFMPVWISKGWYSIVSGSIPTILGFTIASFAALLAFSDKGFVDAQIDQGPGGAVSYFLDEDGKRKVDLELTDYIKNFATFVHFIVIQIISFILCLASQASENLVGTEWSIPIFSVTFLSFIYAILLSAASTMTVFRAAFKFQAYRGNQLARERSSTVLPKIKQ